jgi:type I restriction enzyme, S subunit
MKSLSVLSDLCLLIVDCEHKTAPLVADGYPSIRTPNVGRGRLKLDGVNRVDRATYKEWTKRAVPQPDDLIIAREAPLGNVAIVRQGDEVCLGQRTVLVRPDPAKVDPLFLCYYLLGDYAQSRFHGAAIGATVPHLNMKDIRNLPIPALPPLPTQRRIASILGTYDDLIDVNRRRIGLLEEMTQRLFEEWFVRFRFPGHEGHAMVETPDGPLPEGWQSKKVAEVCASIDYGYTASSQPEGMGPKFLRITDIVPSAIDWSAVPHCQIEKERIEKYSLREGDIVIARTGATVGYAKRINKRHPSTVYASYLVRLRPLPEMSSLMIGIFVQSDAYKAYVKSHAGGSAQPNANAKVLSGVRLTVPSDTVQRKFQAVVEPMCDANEVLQMQNSALASSRDLLLPRLISGEISVASGERELEAVA